MATQNAINNYGIPAGKRIIQDTGPIEYDPSAAQALTTTYADVDGSDYSFTPVSASSTIVYKYSFQHSVVAANDGYTYFRLLVDGTAETESEAVMSMETTNVFAQAFETYCYTIQSWGMSAKTIKMQGKENAAGVDVKLHETYPGGLVRATLQITEYL
jgi:hypothetical protein